MVDLGDYLIRLNDEISGLGIGVGIPDLVDFESGEIWKRHITTPLTEVSFREKLEQL